MHTAAVRILNGFSFKSLSDLFPKFWVFSPVQRCQFANNAFCKLLLEKANKV